MLPRACITCGRPSLAGASRCLAHSPMNSGWAKYAAKHPDRAAYYSSGAWRERRARHIADNPNCVVCGDPARHADHIVGLAAGGAFRRPAAESLRGSPSPEDPERIEGRQSTRSSAKEGEGMTDRLNAIREERQRSPHRTGRAGT
jgi:5-methylcytosine-specific restriction endonuclease McrA